MIVKYLRIALMSLLAVVVLSNGSHVMIGLNILIIGFYIELILSRLDKLEGQTKQRGRTEYLLFKKIKKLDKKAEYAINAGKSKSAGAGKVISTGDNDKR